MKIEPIETRYAGCLFRSRQEARWAVLFDDIGQEWEYEPQGYELDNGDRYLPDFWLPDLATWVEVKGQPPAPEEIIKATLLAQAHPDRQLVITWEKFDGPTSERNLLFWTDKHGVFHSRRGYDWLPHRWAGWAAARSARFEHDAPRWRNAEPTRIRYGRLPY